jgi:hypothetical protein
MRRRSREGLPAIADAAQPQNSSGFLQVAVLLENVARVRPGRVHGLRDHEFKGIQVRPGPGSSARSDRLQQFPQVRDRPPCVIAGTAGTPGGRRLYRETAGEVVADRGIGHAGHPVLAHQAVMDLPGGERACSAVSGAENIVSIASLNGSSFDLRS